MTDLRDSVRDRAVQLYDAFTHEHRDRRRLLREMALLAGSLAAAEGLIAGIAASPAAAAMVADDDPRLTVQTITGTKAGAPASAYVVGFRHPPAKRPGYVLVIHENRGLTPHIRDVARRVALAGFRAIAPDLLAPQGGTPADEDRARAMIATLDYDLALAQVREMIAKAAAQPIGDGRVGAVGFCWGGGFVDRLAVATGAGGRPELAAGVSYYGPAPAPSEAAKVRTPLLLHYAGKDARVAATGVPWTQALQAAHVPVEAYTYAGVDHGFNNDTSAERYDKAAADLAWSRTTAFFHAHLDG